MNSSMHRIAIAALLGLSAFTGPAWAERTGEPITIESEVNLPTASGEFVVSSGAAALGCSAGTFTDAFHSNGTINGAMTRVLTCTVGGAGTISLNIQPLTSTPTQYGGDGAGHWTILRSDGDFAGLHGGGDYEYAHVDASNSVDAIVGFIH